MARVTHTCWHVENKSPQYEAPIFTAQTRYHLQNWKDRDCRIVVIKFYASANSKKVTKSTWVYMRIVCGIEIENKHKITF